jgi:hypothetical protein
LTSRADTALERRWNGANAIFAVLADLDARSLRSHVLVITRYRMTAQDCQRLNDLTNVKLTLLFTYWHRRQAHRCRIPATLRRTRCGWPPHVGLRSTGCLPRCDRHVR